MASSRAHAHPSSGNGIKSFLIFILTLAILCGLVWGGWTYMHQDREGGGLLTPSDNDSGAQLAVAVTTAAPNSLDIRTDSSSALDQALLGNVYETLLKRTTDNGIAPGIAASWQTSGDGLTYTFQLNSGMHFANGDALDAADIVSSLQQSVHNAYVGADKLTGLASVSNSDANTVVMTLSKPNPDLLWLLSGRAGIIYDTQAQIDYATTALGSGPFSVTSFEAGKSLILQRNTNYWNKSAAAQSKTITINYFSDANLAATALAKGEADLLVETPVSSLDTLRSQSNITLAQVDSTRKVLLGFNSRADSLCSEVHIRQGARFAINHQAIADGNGAAGVLGGPIPPLDPGYEDLTGLYPYSKAESHKRIDYFGMRNTMRFVVPMRYGQQLADQIASDLEAVGYHIDVQMVDDATWQTRVVEQHDFDMTIYSMDGSHDVFDLADPNLFLGYTDSQAENLAKQATAATNDAEYNDRLKALAKRLSENAAADLLYVERPWIAYRSDVTGVPTFNRPDVSLPLETLNKA